MIILNKNQMKQIFSMKQAILAVKEALVAYTKNETDTPLRLNLPVKEQNGQALFMPSYVKNLPALGMKIVSVFPDNTKKNLPSVPAQMILMDPFTGMVCALIEGTYLTQLRTGAVSGLATELLSRTDSKIMALIGTGGQAFSQLEAVLCVRPIEQVRVLGLDFEKTLEFVKKSKKAFPHIDFTATKSSSVCIENADIITTVTTSHEPTFNGSQVKPGAHINGVGSYTPEMKELDNEIIKRASHIYFDTKAGVLSEAGDFLIAQKEGAFSEESLTGELGELIMKKTPNRTSPEDITLFKTVGSAVLDVVTAHKIYEKAKKTKTGTFI